MSEQEYVRICTFFGTQEHIPGVDVATLRAASRREELGITSLGVILLVANYMEAHGGADAEFDPDWIPRLDDMQGIFSVLREIDEQKARRS